MEASHGGKRRRSTSPEWKPVPGRPEWLPAPRERIEAALTPAPRQNLQLAARSLTYDEIARERAVSRPTVNTQFVRTFELCHVQDMSALLFASLNAGVLPKPEPRGPRPKMTTRRLAILVGVARGFTDAEIGERIGISKNTVKQYIRTLQNAFGATNRVGLVNEAFAHGLLYPIGSIHQMFGRQRQSPLTSLDQSLVQRVVDGDNLAALARQFTTSETAVNNRLNHVGANHRSGALPGLVAEGLMDGWLTFSMILPNRVGRCLHAANAVAGLALADSPAAFLREQRMTPDELQGHQLKLAHTLGARSPHIAHLTGALFSLGELRTRTDRAADVDIRGVSV
jgi:DNA-binding NarL/FixJ family response regulator